MWKIALVFTLIAGSATFYMTSQTYQNTPKSAAERTWFDKSGNLHVMGIILNKSSLRDAEKAFMSRADAAIFLYPDEGNNSSKEKKFHGELEAYFPAIADHSKVILKMKTTTQGLEEMRKRGTSPRIYPNGVIRVNLDNQDVTAIQHMIVREFILVPSIQLDADILKAQFGVHTSTKNINKTSIEYTFPKLGLVVTINQDGKDRLVFSNPK